jgi:hypothetical protein
MNYSAWVIIEACGSSGFWYWCCGWGCVSAQTTIRSVQLEGVSVAAPEQVGASLYALIGTAPTDEQLRAALEAVEAWYRQRGYTLARVVDYTLDESGALTVQVAEGVIERIEVRGNTRTRTEVLRRLLGVRPGEVYNEERLQRVAPTHGTLPIPARREAGRGAGRTGRRDEPAAAGRRGAVARFRGCGGLQQRAGLRGLRRAGRDECGRAGASRANTVAARASAQPPHGRVRGVAPVLFTELRSAARAARRVQLRRRAVRPCAVLPCVLRGHRHRAPLRATAWGRCLHRFRLARAVRTAPALSRRSGRLRRRARRAADADPARRQSRAVRRAGRAGDLRHARGSIPAHGAVRQRACRARVVGRLSLHPRGGRGAVLHPAAPRADACPARGSQASPPKTRR